MHTSNPCIICNYIGNICNYMRKQLKPTAFQANMNQDFFFLFPSCSAALIYPAEVRISHRHIYIKNPWPMSGSFKIFWADDTDVCNLRGKSETSLLNFCCFFIYLFLAHQKGSRQYVFEACSLYTAAAPEPLLVLLWVISSWKNQPTYSLSYS